MNVEENRLGTFDEWPREAVVTPTRIAKAGFFAVKEGLTVECFSCHARITNWNYGDQVMAKHRAINPTCPFVLDPTTSGNVPIISSSSSSSTTPQQQQPNSITPQINSSSINASFHSNHNPSFLSSISSNNVPLSQQQTSSSRQSSSSSSSATTVSNSSNQNSISLAAHFNPESLKDEAARLKTFRNWPVSHIVTPDRLAKAGFYYLKIGDNTKCAFCKGVVRAWEPGDDPDYEHKRHFGDCPYVLTVIVPRLAVTMGQNNSSSTNNPDEVRLTKDTSFSNLNLVAANENPFRIGVQTHKGPKKFSFATLEARLKSFRTWPPDLIQTPDVLAQAGFYYEGIGDQVRCFHCDGGLRHWDPQDDPWTEHARWFPRCSFIKLVKGQDFVNACSMENNVTSNLEEVEHRTSNPSGNKKREVTERELQEHLSSDVALSALSIGLNLERVKQAIREKLEQTGRGYSQADALVEAALNLQRDEEDHYLSEDHHHSESLSRNNSRAPTSNNNSVGGGGTNNNATTFVKNVVTNVLESLVTSAHSGDQGTGNNKAPAPQTDAVKTLANSTNVDQQQNPGIDSDLSGKESRVSVSLEEENRRLKEARLCKICMDSEVGIVFLPCGHLATCINCAPNLEDCPVCRSAIKATVRTFLS